jgi:hypothetical protein
VSLFDIDGLRSSDAAFAGILKTRQIYLRLFQRKLQAAGCPFVDFSKFQKLLQKLKIFATFLDNFNE